MEITKEESEICKDAASVPELPLEHVEEDCSSLQFMTEQGQHEKHHSREQNDYNGHEFPTEVQLHEPVTASHAIIEASAHPIPDITLVDANMSDHDDKYKHTNTNSSEVVDKVNPQIIFSDSGISLQTNCEASVDNFIDSSCVDVTRCTAAESFRNIESDNNTEIDKKITTNNIGEVEVFPNGDDTSTADRFNATGMCEKHAIKCNSLESENLKIEDLDEETGKVKIDNVKDTRERSGEGNPDREIKDEIMKLEEDTEHFYDTKNGHPSCGVDAYSGEGDQSGTEEEQTLFMVELEAFFKERSMEFKPPKFYGEGLNCLKLWRAVIKLGGYEQVTSSKLWRQVGELFNPPKTCTTVSWTFRCFYEKTLLEFEKYKLQRNVSPLPNPHVPEPNIDCQISNHATPGRARRDAAARAMQGWHSNHLLGCGEEEDVGMGSSLKRDKQPKQIGPLKRKKTSVEHTIKAPTHVKSPRTEFDRTVMDIGTPADWVKINVHKTHDCFEVYVLVPGLLREEVHVQSDPVGRLVITGQPEEVDNPWGVTPFKKVVSLPSRIDAHQTSAVVTLYGQLFVRVPFEHTNNTRQPLSSSS